MKTKCSVCEKEYEENDEDNFIFIESDCPMICYKCIDRQNREFENKYQPERSKREDYVEFSEHDISHFIRDYLLMNVKHPIKCNLEELGKVVLKEIHRCGALNSMET